MMEQRNRVVQVSRFGDPGRLEVVEAPLPTAGSGEVRVRVLASSLNYTEVLIRRHLYPQTMRLRPPFVMGYDVVGAIDQLGEGVHDFQIGDRVADVIEAVDLNPVHVGPKGGGVRILDALIIPRRGAATQTGEQA